jgi:hypothetical protein
MWSHEWNGQPDRLYYKKRRAMVARLLGWTD